MVRHSTKNVIARMPLRSMTKRRQASIKRELERLGVYVPKMSVNLTLHTRDKILQAAKHDAISLQACTNEYHALLF